MRMSALFRERSGAFRPVGIVSEGGLPSVKFIYACICRRKLNKIKRCSPQLRIGIPKSSAMANTFVRFIFYSSVPGFVKRKAYKKHIFQTFLNFFMFFIFNTILQASKVAISLGFRPIFPFQLSNLFSEIPMQKD